MFERFTDRARKVMQLANQEAQRFNHEYIGSEHILLGIVKEGSGVAANVVKNLDVDLQRIPQEFERIVQRGPVSDSVTLGRLPHTPRARKVIEYSIEEARNLNQNYVGTEHLLLGLIRDQDGVAFEILKDLGVNLEYVHEEIVKLVGNNKKSEEKITGNESSIVATSKDYEKALVKYADEIMAESAIQVLHADAWLLSAEGTRLEVKASDWGAAIRIVRLWCLQNGVVVPDKLIDGEDELTK